MGRLDLPDPWRDEDDSPPPRVEVSLPDWTDTERRDVALDLIAVVAVPELVDMSIGGTDARAVRVAADEP